MCNFHHTVQYIPLYSTQTVHIFRIVAKLFPEADEPYNNVKANFRHWSRLRDVYKRRKPASTSSLEVFEDDTLEDELEIEQQA